MDNKSDNESCGGYTDYETDGFWSSEKTLLESVKGDATAADAATACRRRKKKKKAKERVDSKTAAAAATGKGLKHQWRCFRQEHDREWRDFWRIGRKCFTDTVRDGAMLIIRLFDLVPTTIENYRFFFF